LPSVTAASRRTRSSDGSAPLRWAMSRRRSAPRGREVHAAAEAAELAEDALDLGPAARAGVVMGRDDEHRRVGRPRARGTRAGAATAGRRCGGRRGARRPGASAATRRRKIATGVEEREAGLLGLGPASPLGAARRRRGSRGDLGDPARAGAEVGREALVGALGGERADDLAATASRTGAAAVPAARERDEPRRHRGPGRRASRARRVLPIPGSPVSSTSPPRRRAPRRTPPSTPRARGRARGGGSSPPEVMASEPFTWSAPTPQESTERAWAAATQRVVASRRAWPRRR
jgi:hypothetical protein